MKATRTEHVEPADRIFTTAPVWHVLLLSTIAIVLPPSKAFCVVASTSTQRHLLRPGMNHFIRVGTTERDGTQHRKEVELQKQKYFWVQYVGYPVCREEAMTSLVFTRTASKRSHCCGTYVPETVSLCEKGGRDGPTPAITIDASCHASCNPAVGAIHEISRTKSPEVRTYYT